MNEPTDPIVAAVAAAEARLAAVRDQPAGAGGDGGGDDDGPPDWGDGAGFADGAPPDGCAIEFSKAAEDRIVELRCAELSVQGGMTSAVCQSLTVTMNCDLGDQVIDSQFCRCELTFNASRCRVEVTNPFAYGMLYGRLRKFNLGLLSEITHPDEIENLCASAVVLLYQTDDLINRSFGVITLENQGVMQSDIIVDRNNGLVGVKNGASPPRKVSNTVGVAGSAPGNSPHIVDVLSLQPRENSMTIGDCRMVRAKRRNELRQS